MNVQNEHHKKIKYIYIQCKCELKPFNLYMKQTVGRAAEGVKGNVLDSEFG